MLSLGTEHASHPRKRGKKESTRKNVICDKIRAERDVTLSRKKRAQRERAVLTKYSVMDKQCYSQLENMKFANEKVRE